MQYELAMKTPQLKRYNIADKALTLYIYPANLRVENEEKDKFHVRNLPKSAMKEKHRRTEKRSLSMNGTLNKKNLSVSAVSRG